MPKGQTGSILEMGRNVLSIDCRLGFVRRQQHHHISALHRVCCRHDLEPTLLGLPPRCTLPEPNRHIHPTVFQIQGMGMSLTTIPDDRYFLTADVLKIGIPIIVNLHVQLLKSGYGRWAIDYGENLQPALAYSPLPIAYSLATRFGWAATGRTGSRAIATRPVLTNSLMPSGCNRLMIPSIFLVSPATSIV